MATDLLLCCADNSDETYPAARCLHPSLASLFAPLAESQSVGLESPRHYIQRNFSECLSVGVEIGTDEWALLAELYERPLESAAS